MRNKELKIIPDMFEKTWYSWLENSRDWCISRQLWWGHRIPAFFVRIDEPNAKQGCDTDGEYWVTGRTEEEARTKAAEKFKVTPDKIILEQGMDCISVSIIFRYAHHVCRHR